jgi:precorrin-6Y C5,15-methyltransferase (decarboxylating)
MKFKTSNLEVIEGIAPQAIVDLEVPTAAFIGGTSGNLKEIIKILLDKNPHIKIVINAITLETLGEVIQCIKELFLKNVDITQVSISKGKPLGNYNMMIGQNPIYIISFEGIDSK